MAENQMGYRPMHNKNFAKITHFYKFGVERDVGHIGDRTTTPLSCKPFHPTYLPMTMKINHLNLL